ncbi:MAG: methyl-accepting chemotaxis protein [Bacillota bacterium]
MPRLSAAAAIINIILCYISLIVMRHFSSEDLYKYAATFSASLPLAVSVLIVISVRARSLLFNLAEREEEQKKLLISMETLITRSAETSGQVYQSGQKLVDAVKTSELSVHGIASMSEELSATIEEVGASLAEINMSSATVASAATEGGGVLTKANLQMEVIGEIVQKLAAMIRELNDSSQKIGEVINVISTIAGQTNLLALNAAIEAARAGEHGRGFALVAVEVKRLADNSSKAAEEVAVLINKVQADTNGIVGAMEEGITAVNSGSELVQEAGDVFKGILNSTQMLADNTAQIATATKEIEQSGLQVASVSDEQFSFIQKTAAEAKSLMAAAQELNMNLQRE